MGAYCWGRQTVLICGVKARGCEGFHKKIVRAVGEFPKDAWDSVCEECWVADISVPVFCQVGFKDSDLLLEGAVPSETKVEKG